GRPARAAAAHARGRRRPRELGRRDERRAGRVPEAPAGRRHRAARIPRPPGRAAARPAHRRARGRTAARRRRIRSNDRAQARPAGSRARHVGRRGRARGRAVGHEPVRRAGRRDDAPRRARGGGRLAGRVVVRDRRRDVLRGAAARILRARRRGRVDVPRVGRPVVGRARRPAGRRDDAAVHGGRAAVRRGLGRRRAAGREARAIPRPPAPDRLPRPEDGEAMKSLAFVLPIYNEQDNIPLLYERLSGVAAGLADRFTCEFVFVDDGSRDRSLALLRELRERDDRVSVYALARNKGHQIAVTAGIDVADADAVIVMDADLQDPPEVAVALIDAWEDGADVAYARRRTRDDGLFKRATAGAFYWTLSKLARIEIPRDTG